jgi:hypothetical protein
MGRLVHGGIALRVEDDLRDTGPVSQVDKQYHPVIAATLHPPVQYDSLADMGPVQLSAPVRSALHVTLAFFTRR